MSSSTSSHVLPSAALGLDAQELLLVVPLVERLGLVEALVALQADQAGAGHLGHRLGQLGLAGAGRALDQDRLAAAGRRGTRRRRCPRRRGSRPCRARRGPAGRTRSGTTVSHPGSAIGADLTASIRSALRGRPVSATDLAGRRGRRTCAVVSSRRPMGPRAWSFWVEMPISAPKPNSSPSTKRVEALTSTAAASTSCGEAVGGGEVVGDDGLAVAGAVAGDVVDGGVERRRPPARPASGRGTRWRSRRRWPAPTPAPRISRVRVVADQLDAVERVGDPAAGRRRPRRGARAASRRRCTPTAAGSWR